MKLSRSQIRSIQKYVCWKMDNPGIVNGFWWMYTIQRIR